MHHTDLIHDGAVGLGLPIALADVAQQGVYSLGGLASLVMALAVLVRACTELLRVWRARPESLSPERIAALKD
jgi:hypothetical protein